MRTFILPRYLLREHLSPFCFSLAVITMIFLLDLLFRYLNRILSKGLDLAFVLEFFVLNLAWIIATAVPMAVLAATLMTFGRLAADNEIAAMQASGISLWRQIAPIFGGAALLALGLVWFNDNVLPNCNLRVRTLATDMMMRKPSVQIEPGVWFKQIPQYGLLVQTLNDSGSHTRAQSLLIEDNSEPEVRRTISARSGLIQTHNGNGLLQLTLFEGEIQELNITKVEQFRRLTFAKHTMAIGAKDSARAEQEAEARTDREKSTQLMWEEVNKTRAEIALLHESLAQLPAQANLTGLREAKLAEISRLESIAQGLLVEIHKKYAIPAACLVFVLIGAPLGTLTRRGGIGTGASLSLFFFLFYWAGLIGGEVLADRQMLSPILAMWFANLITGLFGVGVFCYVTVGHFEMPALSLLPPLAAIFSKWFGRRKRAEKTVSAERIILTQQEEHAPEERLAPAPMAARVRAEKKATRKTAPPPRVATEIAAITFDVAEPEFVKRAKLPATASKAITAAASFQTPHAHEILRLFVAEAHLVFAFISDRNGNVRAKHAAPYNTPVQHFDFNQLATLAAAQMSMIQVFGKMLEEEGEFTCIFQEGRHHNLFIYQIDPVHLMVVLAESTIPVGAIRIHANWAVKNLNAV